MPDEETEDAREGTLLHDYSAHPEYDRRMLKPNQRDLLELCDDLVKQVITRVRLPQGRLFNESNLTEKIEQTLSLDNGFSGRPDQLLECPEYILVIDKKFGFIIVERAELNIQLRAYAVLANEGKEPKPTYTSIVQPRAPYDQRITLAYYTKEDIIESRKQILHILELTTHDRAPLNPGEEQCRNCKARAMCPALSQAITKSLAPFVSDTTLTKAAKLAYVEDRLSQITDKALATTLEALSFADFVSSPVKDEARKRIREGRLESHYLGKESEVREIADVKRAISLLTLSRVMDKDELLELANLPVSNIEEYYRKRTGVTWKEARDKVNKVLSSVIAITTRKARILKK